MIITIDGPTASGKSTVARLLANRLHWYYLNSGLLYRALGYLLHEVYHYDDQQIMQPTSSDIVACLQMMSYGYDEQNGASIMVNGHPITRYLKTDIVDRLSSLVAANHEIRTLLLAYQRTIAQQHTLVVDGRDTGSVVFPDAHYKFFLTATPSVRAERWRHDQARQGRQFSIQESNALIKERDHRDSSRTEAPLRIPVGAWVIDNSCMTAEETVNAMLRYIHMH